jgi:RimJ/RimL family protein N-acetyltransferase
MLKAPPSTVILETERTIMTPHQASDFEDCAAMWGDPAVTRHITGHASTRQEAWSRHLRNIGHWAALGFGYWVVRNKVDGAFLGEVGFADFQRAIEPPLGNRPEMGWVLCSTAQGRGLAHETVSEAAAWGDRHFLSDTTVCIIAPEHTSSISVARKQGFADMLTTTYMGTPTLVMARHKPE